jgi:hypothetical protein
MVVMLVGSLAFTQVTATTSLLLLGASMFVRGIGLGLSMMPMTAASYASLDHAAVPRATTTTNILRQVGGSIATAVLAVVLQHQIEVQTGVKAASFSTLPPHLPPHVANQVASAFGISFWWALGAIALAIIPTIWLPKRSALPAPQPGIVVSVSE